MPRVIVWTLHLALPLAGLWLLLARPQADMQWHDSPSHFWLVLVVSLINVGLGWRMGLAASRRRDTRLFLVSLAFSASAGFFALHALATPGVLVHHANLGFDAALPVGLFLASALAALSALPLHLSRARPILAVGLAVLILAWGAVSLLDLPPLNGTPGTRETEAPLAAVAVALFLIAAVQYYRLHRRAPAAMLISIVTAFVLLAEAMVAVALAPNWHLSWWEWHVLLLFAFGFVAYSAYVQYGREGTSAGLFDAITLDVTARAIRAEYGAALEEWVTALDNSATAAASPAAVSTWAAPARTSPSAASSPAATPAAPSPTATTTGPAADRGAPSSAAADAGVIHSPGSAGSGAMRADGGMSIEGDSEAGRRRAPADVTRRLAERFGLSEGQQAVLERAAVALSAEREVSRKLNTLFRHYLSPDVAAALIDDPDQAALGGSLVEVTALFADLRGFTTFSEAVEPAEIVAMLNRYHGVAVPSILDNGGTIVQFVGDALLALFNAPARQPDHALRAVRAALRMQEEVERIARERPEWPRFRVGANTGQALVGNIGSEQLRGFNAMGDAVNVAARLQSLATPGQVIIGESTYAAIGEAVRAEPLGELEIRGRVQPVRAYVVNGLA